MLWSRCDTAIERSRVERLGRGDGQAHGRLRTGARVGDDPCTDWDVDESPDLLGPSPFPAFLRLQSGAQALVETRTVEPTKIAEGTPAEVKANPLVVKAYLGSKATG